MSTGPERWVYAVTLLSATIFFAIVFVVGWTMSKLKSKAFRAMSWADRGDWSSRLGSTVHSLIIVPGFITCLCVTDWDSDLWPVDESQPSVTASRIFMCISLGYFAIDFLIMVVFRIPLWVVFVVHHIVACLPLYIHIFSPDCRFGTFPVVGYFLVETANIFMNTLGFLDNEGMKNTSLYTVLFYINFIGWPFWRIIWPLLMVLLMWMRVYYDVRTSANRECLIPAMACGHLIFVFCTVVFLGVLVPDFIRRWSTTLEAVDAVMEEEEATSQEEGGTELEGSAAVPYGRRSEVEEADGTEIIVEHNPVSVATADAERHSTHNSRPNSQPPTPSNLTEVGSLVMNVVLEIAEGPDEGDRRSIAEGISLKASRKEGHDGTTHLK